MATAKKTTTTKKTTTKKPAVTTKAATTKKSTSVSKKTTNGKSHKSVSSKAKSNSPEYKSFKLSKDEQKFTDFRITKQTVYWVILICFIIFVQLWILKLQIEVTSLVEAQQAELLNSSY